jgi:hypothetical protein
MSSKKQTAVKWLVEQIDNKDMGEIPMWIYDFIEQAKEMEKLPIIDAWHNGYNNQSPMIDEDNCGEKYYEENYEDNH